MVVTVGVLVVSTCTTVGTGPERTGTRRTLPSEASQGGPSVISGSVSVGTSR